MNLEPPFLSLKAWAVYEALSPELRKDIVCLWAVLAELVDNGAAAEVDNRKFPIYYRYHWSSPGVTVLFYLRSQDRLPYILELTVSG